MQANRIITASAVLLACSLAQAAEERYDMMYDAEMRNLTSNLNTASSLKLGVQLQFRYDVNVRDDSPANALGDNDTTIGFSMRRAKVEAKGDITDSISGKVVFAFNRNNGTAVLEDAVADWAINDSTSLQIGQFKLPFLREESVSSKKQLASERSSMNETFNQDRAQGIQLTYAQGAFRAMFAISDGFNSDNTSFNAAPTGTEQDFAITGRGEFKFGDADWKAYDQFTSFRGSASGGMIGVAGHFQTSGDTNPSAATSTESTHFTVDGSYVADGWNLFGAFLWRNTDTGATDFDDMGAVVQGGIFVSDQAELFARWSAVFPDSARGATGNDYSDITAGLNYYIVPESHAAKVTVGLTYSLDSTSGSIVSVSDGHNLFADTEDGQIALTTQLQVLF